MAKVKRPKKKLQTRNITVKPKEVKMTTPGPEIIPAPRELTPAEVSEKLQKPQEEINGILKKQAKTKKQIKVKYLRNDYTCMMNIEIARIEESRGNIKVLA